MASPTSSRSTDITIHPPLEVSPLDSRLYRAITLPNALSVLLISDPLSELAAASMHVAVGSFSDPPAIPGLAHFLEHMLFLGTQRYPDEDSYNSFLSEHAGVSNAFTSSESTNFHFAMAAPVADGDSLREALDRFSQFFIAPLFTEAATDREMHAVHSEFHNNLMSDVWRIDHVFRAETNAAHPCSSFHLGNLETLRDAPQRSGIDVRAELVAFHDKYYSANRMKLCVVAPHSLDVLHSWVAEFFSAIRNLDVPPPWDVYREVTPLLPSQMGRRIYVETVMDVRLLELTWLTPTFSEDFRSKPDQCLRELLNDEAEGSILSLLKDKDWADSLSASMNRGRTFAFFSVAVGLTRKGVDHTDDIVSIIYDYLRLLHEEGLPDWFFKEEAMAAERGFRFREPEGVGSLATALSMAMHYFPPEEYVSALWLYKEYAPERMKEILDCLTPERGIITVAGQFVSDKLNMTERWFGTKYGVEIIAAHDVQRWRGCDRNAALHLPVPNPLVPQDFKVLGEQLPAGAEDDEGPAEIACKDAFALYHKLDRTFNRPKAIIFLQIDTPQAMLSPRHVLLFGLYVDLLEDAMTEFSWIAGRAGFGFWLSSSFRGLSLSLAGFNDGIERVLNEIIRRVAAFEPDATRCEMQRDALQRNLENYCMCSPMDLAGDNISLLLCEPAFSHEDLRLCLQNNPVTLGDLESFSRQALKRSFITGLMYGNVLADTSINLMQSVQNTLGTAVLPEGERPTKRIVQLPQGADFFFQRAHLNAEDKNSAIVVYYQLEPQGDFFMDATIEVLADVLEKPMFHELRTVQQLGYICQENLSYFDDVGGIEFVIQSTVACPDKLLRRIDQFLIDVRDNSLETMTEETMQGHIGALIALKSEPDRRLSARAERFLGEIMDGHFRYDRQQKDIEALRKVRKRHVLQLFDDYIAHGGAKRKRIVSQVFGNLHPFGDRENLPEGAVAIDDPVVFQRQNALFPALLPKGAR